MAQTRKKAKREQWFTFQKVWLANLRRDLLGTEEHFGNPLKGCHVDSNTCVLPDAVPDPNGGKPKRTLVVDLDETLVHTEFDQSRGWITHVRPGVASFLAALSGEYELCVFTAGLAEYASPIIDQLDPKRLIKHRLYREHASALQGVHVKDLARLNRDLARTVIVDNSPESYVLQPENAVPIKPFFGDPNDLALLELIPFLAHIVADDTPDVRKVLKKCHRRGRFVLSQASEERMKEGPPHDAEGKERRVSDLGATSGRPGVEEEGDEDGPQRRWSDLDRRKLKAFLRREEEEGGDLHRLSSYRVLQVDVGPDEGARLCGSASGRVLSSPASGVGSLQSPALHRRLQRTQTFSEGTGAHGELGHGPAEPPHSASGSVHEAEGGGGSSSDDDTGAAEREGPAARRDGGGGLSEFVALSGACADVLRGMSPPPSFLPVVRQHPPDADSEAGGSEEGSL